MNVLRISPLVLLLSACAKAPPEANPEFSDATVYAFRAFEGSDADLAFGLRALEEVIYLTMDVDSPDVRDRALSPNYLESSDLEGLETPEGADVANALPVAVSGRSAYAVQDATLIQLLADQTPVEPYSPDKYDRTFIDGTDACWADRGCDTLLTFNDLIKENLLMTVPYTFYKDFRWIDMELPDPADVPEGEVAVNEGEPRWAFVARSWMTESAEGENGNSRIIQSYTVEVWIPRDGQGFVRDGTETNLDGGEWTADSDGGGTLRFLTLWGETAFDGINPSEDTIAGTTRAGINDNLMAQEEWLDENVGGVE